MTPLLKSLITCTLTPGENFIADLNFIKKIKHMVVPGDGASGNNRGAARRRHNQMLMETVNLPTLRHSLMTRGEQAWGCPACQDSDGVYR